MPTAEELREYYSRYSYDSPDSWRVDAATEASLAKLERALRRYRTAGRLLDVGCGAGSVLRAMRSAGWDAEGQEVSDAAADRLEREGLRVHRGSLEQLGPRSYDVVVMSEVIEHLPEPGPTLRAVHGLLRPGGALYLTTPNFASLSRRMLGDRWRAIELPGHLTYFDSRSLAAQLAGARFQSIRVWSEGLNPYELVRRGQQSSADAEAVRSQTEALRLAAARPGIVSLARRSVNQGLRLLGLGDTLKALAER